MKNSDFLTDDGFDVGIPFLIEGTQVHGSLVRLGAVGHQILRRHKQAAIFNQNLAELLALTACLYNGQKQRGILSLGVNGSYKILRLLADARAVHSDNNLVNDIALEDLPSVALRATLEINSDIEMELKENLSLTDLTGEAYLTLTLDPEDNGIRSQGIVAINKPSLERAMDEYFLKSSQERAFCKLAGAKINYQNHSPDTEPYSLAAGAILLRQMPISNSLSGVEEMQYEEDWNYALAILNTLEADELLDVELSNENLLQRLFHERGIRVFDPINFIDQCQCSKERMVNVLKSLDKDERRELVTPKGNYEVTCLFCNQQHDIQEEDLK